MAYLQRLEQHQPQWEAVFNSLKQEILVLCVIKLSDSIAHPKISNMRSCITQNWPTLSSAKNKRDLKGLAYRGLAYIKCCASLDV
jgi:hypothetical protein